MPEDNVELNQKTRRGYSLAFVVGAWAPPKINIERSFSRICLGFVSIIFFKMDLEYLILNAVNRSQRLNALEAKLDRLIAAEVNDIHHFRQLIAEAKEAGS